MLHTYAFWSVCESKLPLSETSAKPLSETSAKLLFR